jgi:hypothetical protein
MEKFLQIVLGTLILNYFNKCINKIKLCCEMYGIEKLNIFKSKFINPHVQGESIFKGKAACLQFWDFHAIFVH